MMVALNEVFWNGLVSSLLLFFACAVSSRTLTVGGCVINLSDAVLRISCVTIVTECTQTLAIRLGPIVHCCKLLYGFFVKALVDISELAIKGGVWMKTHEPVLKYSVYCTQKSKSWS